jgi:hypothetical protein
MQILSVTSQHIIDHNIASTTKSYIMTKNPSASDKKRKGSPNNDIKVESPKRPTEDKNKHQIIILISHDTKNTPWGYAFANFYDGRNFIKALSNKLGNITTIGTEEFKPFDNLTTKWITSSELGENLWVIRIDHNHDGDSMFPLKCHEAFANKVARAILSVSMFKTSRLDVIKKKLSVDEENDLDNRFVPYYENLATELLFKESIAVKDKALEDLI